MSHWYQNFANKKFDIASQIMGLWIIRKRQVVCYLRISKSDKGVTKDGGCYLFILDQGLVTPMQTSTVNANENLPYLWHVLSMDKKY